MTTDQSAVVPVLPEDSVDVVLARVRDADSSQVQLLVTEGVVALRRPEVAARLYEYAANAGIELTVISSDPALVEAARAAGLATLLVQHARVLAPGPGGRPPRSASPFATRPIERPTTPPAAELDADAAFLESLEELSAIPPGAASPPRNASDEEVLRAALASESAAPPPPRTRAAPPRPTPAAPRPAPTATRRERGWPLLALIAALLLLLIAVGAVLFFAGRVTVAVTPPVRSTVVEPIAGLPVPLAAPGAGVRGTAVEAEAITSDVAARLPGTVRAGTSTPAGNASGTISILNSSAQAILLPAGTEFVAIKADGQEVPFISTGDVLVLGATTSDQGAQIVTTRGQAQVGVTARSAGSGSNVEGNTIRRITPPGGPSFSAASGNLIVQHPPLSGGTEELVFLVKEQDVQPLLAPALEQLDAEARRQLSGLARTRGLALDPSSINPRRSDLEQLQGFETIVDPPQGAIVDPANPSFTLTVQARYSALATADDQPLERQLGPVVTEQLRQAGLIQPGDCRAPTVTGWRWDGQSLLVDGTIGPDTQSPRCQDGLDPSVFDQVRAAVRGKSRAEADTALQDLVAQGVIGSYTLPNAERMPTFGWQIRVEQEP